MGIDSIKKHQHSCIQLCLHFCVARKQKQPLYLNTERQEFIHSLALQALVPSEARRIFTFTLY